MFENQPKGLYALALANTGERFGYYTMIAVFALFLQKNFNLDEGTAGTIYSTFLALVYFLPFIGGILADKFGYGKMVTIGVLIMLAGYAVLSIPLGSSVPAWICMFLALLLISVGTGLFKGNLQVMVGNLYDDPKYASQRDSAFSLFYMAINIGAMFAPTAAVKIMDWAQSSLGVTLEDSYHFAFAVACVSLIVSIIIYYACRPWFRHVEGGKKAAKTMQTTDMPELTKEQTKSRIVALCMVFAVVIFFWMAFHQNGLTLTYFADQFVNPVSTGVQTMAFDVWNLVAICIFVYAVFQIFQSKTAKAKGISGGIAALAVGFLVWQYFRHPEAIDVKAPMFQQFNPFYVVALTPVSMALFGALAKKGKEPSAPRKIAYGMVVAAVAYIVMALCCLNLQTPYLQKIAINFGAGTFANSNVLIGTYLILTFGELLLSPMGISFVTKVAPPKYKGMMMGGWFVATAIGNYLVSIGGNLWGDLPLWAVWSVFVATCLISAAFMFIMMKKLEAATK